MNLALGRILLLAAFAIAAFAGNSLLTRAALGAHSGDSLLGWEMFTGLRLASGAVMLVLLAGLRPSIPTRNDYPGIAALAAYTVFFSLSYLALGAATGALILFATVQITMVATAFAKGEKLGAKQASGMALALAGLVWLLLPGAKTPSFPASLAMVVAGIAWGAYTLLGRNAGAPLAHTARNFVGCLPLALALFGWAWVDGDTLSVSGIALALASGAVTSGIGYAVWYAVLPALGTSLAAVLQLLVPVVAAIGGLVWLGEALTLPLVGASVLILVGIALNIPRTVRHDHA